MWSTKLHNVVALGTAVKNVHPMPDSALLSHRRYWNVSTNTVVMRNGIDRLPSNVPWTIGSRREVTEGNPSLFLLYPFCTGNARYDSVLLSMPKCD